MLPPPYHNRSRLLAVLLLILCGLPAAAHGPADYASLYEEASKSVVDIFEEIGDLGTGVIISPEGHILTNAHVVHDDYGVIEGVLVALQDGNVAEADVIGFDLYSDIALLKIDVEESLPVAKIGDSSKLQTGNAVLAIGHPEGNYYSLSTGVISSLDRFMPVPNDIPAACSIFWIQTDAAVNSGNSGGPLLNDAGEVIGIISWSQTAGDDSGLNFAVPINEAMVVQKALRELGTVPWGSLGVYVDYHLVTDAMGDDILGFLVNQVNKGSGAETAGILPGDVIIEYNEEPFVDGYFGCVPAGIEIPVKLIRDGEEMTVSVTLSPIENPGFLF